MELREVSSEVWDCRCLLSVASSLLFLLEEDAVSELLEGC